MRFRSIAFLAALIFLASCSGQADDPLPVIVPSDPLIDQIKSQAAPRGNYVNINAIQWEKQPSAELSFVQEIMQRSLQNNDTIPLDSMSHYTIYDYQELDSLFLFSISKCDPGGFTSLYHFTLDKDKKKLKACTRIASGREDKGNYCNDKLTYAKNGLSVIVNSQESVYENGITTLDKCSVRYDFLRDSTTSRLLHSVHREKGKTAKR